jgi:hypothetical protein
MSRFSYILFWIIFAPVFAAVIVTCVPLILFAALMGGFDGERRVYPPQ